jgi:hypothetical protein
VPPPPDELWGVEFARDDGLAGFVRLLRFDPVDGQGAAGGETARVPGGRCWYWAYLVGPALGLVVVRDHEVAPPRRADVLEVRADGLWAELVCETAGEHWTIGLEAFAVRLDAPLDALRGEVGERLPVGLDVEWETGDGAGAGAASDPAGIVHGDVLVESDRIGLDAGGRFLHARAPETAWPTTWSGWLRLDDGSSVRPGAVDTTRTGDGLPVPTVGSLLDGRRARFAARAMVPIPLAVEATGRGAVLIRVLTDVRIDGGPTGIGWLEVLHS